MNDVDVTANGLALEIKSKGANGSLWKEPNQEYDFAENFAGVVILYPSAVWQLTTPY